LETSRTSAHLNIIEALNDKNINAAKKALTSKCSRFVEGFDEQGLE